MYRLNREARVLDIEIPWLGRKQISQNVEIGVKMVARSERVACLAE